MWFFLKFSFLVPLILDACWTCVFEIQGASTSERSCFKLPSPYRVFGRRPTDAGRHEELVSMTNLVGTGCINKRFNNYIIMSLFQLGFLKWYSLIPNTIPDHTPNSWLLKLSSMNALSSLLSVFRRWRKASLPRSKSGVVSAELVGSWMLRREIQGLQEAKK